MSERAVQANPSASAVSQVRWPAFDLTGTPLAPGVTLIEASAGTGKTFTIAGLFLRLILERNFSVSPSPRRPPGNCATASAGRSPMPLRPSAPAAVTTT
jgi:UvrD/REP helicase N-terminal domain